MTQETRFWSGLRRRRRLGRIGRTGDIERDWGYNLGMAGAIAKTSTHVPVEVYLQSDYEHDCDYVDGEIEERPAGGWDHATWQKVLLLFFALREKQWKIFVQPELRVQISAKRYR